MLLVRRVTGPAEAAAGSQATYRVAEFNVPNPDANAGAGVSWAVRTPAGATLAVFTHAGPELRLPIPEAWGRQTILVMAYVSSPTARVAVQTRIAAPPPAPPPAGGPRRVRVTREGRSYYASFDDEPRFYVGTEVRYGARRGLMNADNPPGPRYRPEDYEPAHAHWAWYLYPTIRCESGGYFACINTYDRACFTFGHMQLAAHTPDDNFAAFLRELLQDRSAAAYFPDLTVHDGHVHCRTPDGLVCLETSRTTADLMAYFNRTPHDVDDDEVERAARLIAWTVRHRPVRDAQVAFAVREQKRKLARHAQRLRLHDAADRLCIVVLDILHQGRGRYTAIQAALDDRSPFDALLRIGLPQYRERIATLRSTIDDLDARRKVGDRRYDAAAADFV